jgi:hypothetical protein
MGLKFNAELTVDEIRLLDWIFRMPPVLLANGKTKTADGREMAQYAIPTGDQYDFQARMWRKTVRWLEDKVFEREPLPGEPGKTKLKQGAAMYPTVGRQIRLNSEAAGFIGTVIDFYKEICSVGILIDGYYSLQYKFHHNGVPPPEEAFDEGTEEAPEKAEKPAPEGPPKGLKGPFTPGSER